jgi:hypothetical protein
MKFEVITCINDFPLGVNTKSDAIMFANDTSALISNKNYNEFKNAFNTVLNHISKWLTDYYFDLYL